MPKVQTGVGLFTSDEAANLAKGFGLRSPESAKDNYSHLDGAFAVIVLERGE